jgi:hypothetical protein
MYGTLRQSLFDADMVKAQDTVADLGKGGGGDPVLGGGRAGRRGVNLERGRRRFQSRAGGDHKNKQKTYPEN